MEKSTTISNWLRSGEYRAQIDSVYTNITRGCENSRNESQTASVFETEIYFLVRKKLDIELTFSKEEPVEGVIHKFDGLSSRKSGHGRLDAIVNDVVIEYKHHSKLKTERQKKTAFEQVKDYLVTLAKNEERKCDAILTDGIHISYFQSIEGIISHSALRRISADDIDRIIKALLSNQSKKFEPSNIVRDFSISPNSPSESKVIATVLYKQLIDGMSEKSQMLYSEWQGLMHLSVNDNGKSNDISKRRRDLSNIFDCAISDTETEYKALFALQTTYAIIVKLIACKVVDRLNFNTETHEYHDLSDLSFEKMQKFFQNMEDGYSYISMGIRNFLEGDFFSWYADSSQWSDEFWKNIRGVIVKIDDYTSFSLNVKYNPEDIFKDLYMCIIPQSIRHSMGEYFTPEWLADSVISEALKNISDSNWTAIDPCCGSGIFVITLIKKVVGDISINDLNQEEKNALLQSILSRVHGIDINPLSVLSARVSYYIAIHPFGEIKDIEIPIYLGDSAIVPVSKVIDNIDCYSYSISNNKYGFLNVTLPKNFVEKPNFGEIMSKLQALVKAESSEALYLNIIKNFSDEAKKSETLNNSIQVLARNLVNLHKNNWDGIWIRITTNFMLIARLQKHDLIVGNPPWVKWEHLPAAYTRRIKEFCDIRHIFCNDGMYGGAQLNICALISNVAATNWLKNDGTLAFLMPDSLMSQNSYEEFRNFYTNYAKRQRLYLQKLDRWLAPLRPFKVGNKSVAQDFNTYYFSRPYIDYKKGVKVRAISKRKGINDLVINRCKNFEEARKHLVFHNEIAKQMADYSTQFTFTSSQHDFSMIIGPTSYLYRTGVESTPFEIFKMIGEGPSEKANHYRFKNKVLKTSKYKVEDIPIDGWDLPVQYLYPMVEGPSITPFAYDCGNNYHIIPYDKDDTSEPVSIVDLSRDNEELAFYFSNHRDLLDKQSNKSKTMHRGSEFYALSKIGAYTFAPYIVAARDNSYFCASIIRPVDTPWGKRKHAICVKHTIIISQDTNGNFITEDESHYVNAILNSSIVHEYIHATFKTNGFSLKKSNLCIPKYDSSNRLHKRLVLLSKYATLEDNKSRRSRVSEIASTIYCQICVDYKNALIIELQKNQEESSKSLMAAEPFERYKWEGFDQSICDFFGGNQTILVGCYKGKKYQNWILSHNIYNIRLGKTKGSMEANRELFRCTSLLVLYEIGKPEKLSAYRIVDHQEISKEELIEMGYPNKKPRKRYMSFSLEPLDMDLTFLVEHHLIERIIELDANHAKGTPIFIEP